MSVDRTVEIFILRVSVHCLQGKNGKNELKGHACKLSYVPHEFHGMKRKPVI